jgi:hypothetical protein
MLNVRFFGHLTSNGANKPSTAVFSACSGVTRTNADRIDAEMEILTARLRLNNPEVSRKLDQAFTWGLCPFRRSL